MKKLPARPVVVDIGANAGCISVPTIEVHDLDKYQRNVGHLSRFLKNQGYDVVSTPAHDNCHILEASRKK